MELISKIPKIDFISKAPLSMVFSALLIVATVYIWIARGENKFGIDYVGGFEYVVQLKDGASVDQLSAALKTAPTKIFDGAIIQSFSGSTDHSVRFSSREEAKVVRQELIAALKAGLGERFEILKSDFVGPTFGEELKNKALLAVVLALVGITVYVTFRFEFAFAMGVLVALFHDVIIATGIYLWVGHELNGAALAAALTVIGYSVNDTIVIFDKVREEIFKRKDFDLKDLLNEANCMMLSRTIITTVLTLFSALSLLVFGGGAIQDLSLFLVVGIVAGAYSTVFIACPIVYWWNSWRVGRLTERVS